MAPVFWVTPERYESAARRHPGLARRVRATFGWDLGAFDEAMRTTEVLVGWQFPRESLAGLARRLRWIHVTGAGVDHLFPLDWLPPGVVLTTSSGVHRPKAAEYACMAILMLNNRIPQHVTNQHHARWGRVFNTPVSGKTLAVIGVGNMGGAAAEWAKRLGLRVLGVRRSGRPHRFVDEMFTPDQLDQVLPQAECVLVTAPLTAETRGLIRRKELDLLKSQAGLINMARAGVVDYDALAEKLTRGELSGAILDVFDPEPLPAHSPLWGTPNLIITPHVSSDDAEQYTARMLDLFFENLGRYLSNRALRNRVDLARGY